MKHVKTIIALGIMVALVPFLGFPNSWKSIIFAALGLSIATLSFRIFVASRDSVVHKKSKQLLKKNALHSEVAVAHE